MYDPKNDKPYHDTIFILFDAINRADQMQAVADFVIATACPANHDFIITGWRAVIDRLGFSTDTFGVIAALEAKKTNALRQAQIKALSAEINNALPGFGPRSPQDPNDMAALFRMTKRQLFIRYTSDSVIGEIVEYFAKVGLVHGERLDPELVVELRTLGVYRLREDFNSNLDAAKP